MHPAPLHTSLDPSLATLVPSSQGGWVIWAHLAPAGGSVSSGHTWQEREAACLVYTEPSGPEHAEGWEGPGAEGSRIPRAGCAIRQEVPAGWGIDCGQDEGLKAEGAREWRCVHTCRRKNPHSIFTLSTDLPSAPARRTRRDRVDAAFKTPPGPAHGHTWSRSQAHPVQLTDTAGPAHRHTWSSSQGYLVQVTGTPGPAHGHTWSCSRAPGPVAGTSPSWILSPPGWDTVLKSRRGGDCGV